MNKQSTQKTLSNWTKKAQAELAPYTPERPEEKATLTLATLLGVFFGLFAYRTYRRKKTMHPDRVLNQTKEYFAEDHTISGSWIEMKKVPWQKYNQVTDVYYGGFTTEKDGQTIQYEFVADAYRGVILDSYPL